MTTPIETALREERYRVEMRATSRSRIGHLPECRKWQPVGDLEHLSREDAEGHMRGFVERDYGRHRDFRIVKETP